jgi:hypothetical protein
VVDLNPGSDIEPGPFIQTVSGRRINPFAAEIDQIDPDDIARALSNQCRFGGHCRVFYSVAQHACVVSDLIGEGGSDEDALWGLLHDASEAYLVDLPHPLKHRSALGAVYRPAEQLLQSVICRRFGLPPDPPPGLKSIDRRVLATERRAFSAHAWHWPELDGAEPLDIEIEPWLPDRAADGFRSRFERLHGSR